MKITTSNSVWEIDDTMQVDSDFQMKPFLHIEQCSLYFHTVFLPKMHCSNRITRNSYALWAEEKIFSKTA